MYPFRKILPQIYSAGSTFSVPLDGFETAIFHVFPLDSTTRPLLADARMTINLNGNNVNYSIYETGSKFRFLNPQYVENLKINGKNANYHDFIKFKNTSTGTDKTFPKVSIIANGKEFKIATQSVKNKWQWYSTEIPAGQKEITVKISKNGWKGTASLWINTVEKLKPITISVQNSAKINEEIMPPLPYPTAEKRNYQKLTEKKF